ATTIAVILHEVPQEIGDFGVLIHGGFSKKQAVVFNFLTALTAFLGACIAIVMAAYVDGITTYLVPLSAGAFIYIAGSDLIPELHKETEFEKTLLQFFAFIGGMVVMSLLLFLG
ncbi:MAG: ZIP family metal transporter, partial [Candidatus Magasanikbacteria bacterium CG10_big_fil_rev_8_21_14_0_10_38_6]